MAGLFTQHPWLSWAMLAAGGPLAEAAYHARATEARGQSARALVKVPGVLAEGCQTLDVANARLVYAGTFKFEGWCACALGVGC